MTDITDYCDILNLDLDMKYYNNQGKRWTASISEAEVKEGGTLASTYGQGTYPEEAISDYISKIAGKRLVINATGGDRRREFVVPLNLGRGR